MSKNQRVKTNQPDLQQEIRNVGALVEQTNHNVQLIAEQFGSLHQKIDSNTEMVGSMMQDITIIKENVEFLKAGMKKKVDAEEFVALERRVSLLEKRSR